MRKLISVAAAAAALIALIGAGGCGSDDGGEAPAAASEADPSAFPVTIEHKFGATEIAEPPERVVTVGYTEQDTVLALGVKPVGEREFIGGYDYRSRPWAQEALDGYQPEVVGGEQINFESVAAQRPDLILGVSSGITAREYDRLSEIAPTIAQSGDFVDFGMPWQDQTLVIGRALGREERARELVDEVEQRFAEARREHPEFEGSAVLAYGEDGGFGAYASEDTRVRFLEDLGFSSPPQIDELAGNSFFVDLDEERLDLIDQDLVVMFGKRDELLESSVYSRLDAVREERAVYLDLEDQFAGALGFSSPLSLPFLLDEAVPKLAAAVDGDPATTGAPPE
jgi:iron complex transport system substrate-binding protein